MTKNAWYVKDFSGPNGSYSVIYELEPDEPEREPVTCRYTLRLQQIPGPNPEWEDVQVSEKVIEKDPRKGELLTGEHRFFVDGLRRGRDMRPLLRDAYKALEIVLAADRSVRTGQVGRLDAAWETGGSARCERGTG
jgi:predicted dehydrogenase